METVLEKQKIVLWNENKDQQMIVVEKIPEISKKPFYTFLKRMFDIIVCSVAFLILFTPMLIIALVIVLDSKGNPIYSQVRLGKNEKPFTIYKFRSMRIDAEKDGLQWASDGDVRVTKVGKWLRKTHLDELPQIVNILLGQMSIVGPRPERPEFYDFFDTYIVGFRQRTLVVPGLTGYAQVNGGYDLKPEEKIVYDIVYIKNRSLKMDMLCILKTFVAVFKRKGSR